MIVSFCGHKEITEPEKLLPWLEETVEALIQRGADTFYLGGYGAFDRMAADVVWNKKHRGDLQSPGETNGWSITQMS